MNRETAVWWSRRAVLDMGGEAACDCAAICCCCCCCCCFTSLSPPKSCFSASRVSQNIDPAAATLLCAQQKVNEGEKGAQRISDSELAQINRQLAGVKM